MVILLKRPGRLRPAVSQTARCTDITTGGIAAHQPVEIPHANPAGCLLREDKFTTVNNPRWLIFAAGSRKSPGRKMEFRRSGLNGCTA